MCLIRTLALASIVTGALVVVVLSGCAGAHGFTPAQLCAAGNAIDYAKAEGTLPAQGWLFQFGRAVLWTAPASDPGEPPPQTVGRYWVDAQGKGGIERVR